MGACHGEYAKQDGLLRAASTWCFPIEQKPHGGIRVLKGRRRLIICMLMGRHNSPHSAWRLLCVFVRDQVWVREGGGRKEGGFFSFFFQNDMYSSDSHLFGGSFQTVQTMLLHFVTIVPV